MGVNPARSAKSQPRVCSHFYSHAVKDSYFRAKERRDPLFLLGKVPQLDTGLKPVRPTLHPISYANRK